MKKYKVLFADLDGTLIEMISGNTFPKGIWDMRVRFDVLDAIKKLAPDYTFIVTNQGGIEKGFVNQQNLEKPRNFDPFGQSRLSLLSKIRITPASHEV